MLCMTCGHQSADGASVCGNCGAPLRGSSGDVGNKEPLGAPPPYNKGIYKIVALLISMYDDGAIEVDELDKRLADYEDFYRKKVDEIRAMDIPEDQRDVIDEEYRCGLRGTEGLCEAMGTLREYLQTGNSALRDRGLSGVDSSLHLVNTAMRMNWDSANVLAQSMQDMIDQQNGGSSMSMLGDSFSLDGGFALADGMNFAGF